MEIDRSNIPYGYRWLNDYSDDEILDAVSDDVAVMIAEVGLGNTIRLLDAFHGQTRAMTPDPRQAFRRLQAMEVRKAREERPHLTLGQLAMRFGRSRSWVRQVLEESHGG